MANTWRGEVVQSWSVGGRVVVVVVDVDVVGCWW